MRVRETFPDRVLASADEVVLVDLTPEALVQRLREGKVYPPDRVPTALNSFFKVENLSALREVALRQVAEEVESKRLVTPAEALGTREEQLLGDAPAPVTEHLLALVTPDERSQRLVRRAWRSAQRLGGELDLLYVRPPGEPPRGEERQRLEELRRLGTLLGSPLDRGGGRRCRRGRRSRGGGEGHHLRDHRAAARRAAAPPASRSRSPTGSCGDCRALTSGSSPTGRRAN